MCGIAGIIKFSNSSPAPWHAPRNDVSALEQMSDAIAHRGPDGTGIYVDPGPTATAALIHRRLAIIDLPCGQQPMANEDTNVHVVFNGEIYNHRELRSQLQAAGHQFATDHSDTEVLVHGWEQWGTDLPTKLLGMFAFAIWDNRPDPKKGLPRSTLFLARDRMGQKPLFYATLEDGIVFGSTIPAVLAWPEVPRRVPFEQIALYLQVGYLPPPQTIYRDISQIAPGHWLRLQGDLLDGGRYWPAVPGREDLPQQNVAVNGPHEQLRDTLARAVESQLIADVPVACFLSGGVDSSIIALLMQQAVARQGGGPIHTVSVGFTEASFDETAFAARVAKKIGSRHTRLEVNAGQNVMATLKALMRRSLGQPFADSSLLPTHHLSDAVRQIAPVALSGDGSDELFAGYDRYRALMLLRRWGGLARLMPRSAPVGSLRKRERYRRLAAAAHAGTIAEQYARLTDIFLPADLEALLGEVPGHWAQPPENGPLSPLRLAMLTDQQQYLPGDVLWKVDAASMACALEVRSPFLDHRVVGFANQLPEQWLIEGRRGKRLLRDTFAAELPPEVFMRSKQGFGVPIGDWFRGPLRNDLHDLLLYRESFVGTHLRPAAVRRMLEEHQAGQRDHTHRLFSLLMLELWAREFEPVIER